MLICEEQARQGRADLLQLAQLPYLLRERRRTPVVKEAAQDDALLPEAAQETKHRASRVISIRRRRRRLGRRLGRVHDEHHRLSWQLRMQRLERQSGIAHLSAA
jgi:hypothetical protein